MAALSVPAPLTLAGPASAEVPVGSDEPTTTTPDALTAPAPPPDPDTTIPDTPTPDTPTPDTPLSGQTTDTTTPVTTTPATTVPGSPDTTTPDTTTPDTTIPDTTIPDTTIPDTTVPDTTTPDTTIPDTTIPDTTVPDTMPPEEPPPVSSGDQCPPPVGGGTVEGEQPAGESGGSEPSATTPEVTTVEAPPVEGSVPPSPTTAPAPTEPCPDPAPPAASTVTGVVWVDAGGDGFRATEPGRSEVRVELRTCEADPAVPPRTTVTDGNGAFRFEELPAGCYVVVVAPGEGRRFAARQSPDPERTASTVNRNGRSQRIDLDGTGTATVNAALRPPRQARPARANRANRGAQQRARLGAITGVVWNDTDRNGIRGEEAGRPGVPVALRTCNSSADTEPLATTSTDRNGGYRFAGLPVRCYLVTVGPDLDLQFSPRPDAGDDETAEAETDRVLSGVKQTGVSDRIRVARGSTETLNAGITSPPPPPSAIPGAGNSPLLGAGIWMSPRWHRSAWPGLVAGPPAWTLAAAPPAPAGQSNTGSGVPMSISSSGLGPHGFPIVQVANEPDGTMTVPDRGVGWHAGTARPGEGGTVLLAAHVAYNGADGAFRHLATTRPGTVVAVTDDHGTSHLYRVRAVEEYTKSALPLDRLLAPGPDGTETLLLVTCGGAFDPATRSYDTNVVVIAERVGPDSGAPWAAL